MYFLNLLVGGNRMKGRISNPQGDVMIRTDVIAKYAGSMAVECFGHCGMPSVFCDHRFLHCKERHREAYPPESSVVCHLPYMAVYHSLPSAFHPRSDWFPFGLSLLQSAHSIHHKRLPAYSRFELCLLSAFGTDRQQLTLTVQALRQYTTVYISLVLCSLLGGFGPMYW